MRCSSLKMKFWGLLVAGRQFINSSVKFTDNAIYLIVEVKTILYAHFTNKTFMVLHFLYKNLTIGKQSIDGLSNISFIFI